MVLQSTGWRVSEHPRGSRGRCRASAPALRRSSDDDLTPARLAPRRPRQGWARAPSRDCTPRPASAARTSPWPSPPTASPPAAPVCRPRRVLVVTSDERVPTVAHGLGARVVADPGGGLDAAVAGRPRPGRRRRTGGPGGGPAGRPAGPARRTTWRAALARRVGSTRSRSCPDAAGTGTVLLTALHGADLVPSFGAGSAARHDGSRAPPARPRPAPAAHRRRRRPRPARRLLALGVGAGHDSACSAAAATLPPMQAQRAHLRRVHRRRVGAARRRARGDLQPPRCSRPAPCATCASGQRLSLDLG